MLNEDELVNIASPNYTPGRQGTPVRHITFHHVVGPASSAVARFSNPANQVSAHFIVAADRVICMVNTDDTAWCNGNWASNLESVTIEHEGDWRNGYRNEAVIANSARLVAWLRTFYPTATPNRHRDIIATACPGELPVEEIWNRATDILFPKPKPVVKTYQVVETQPVPFAVTTVDDAALDKGKNLLKQTGVQGVRTITYSVTTTDGVETARSTVSNIVTTAPVDQITAIGTKPVTEVPPTETPEPPKVIVPPPTYYPAWDLFKAWLKKIFSYVFIKK